MAFKATFVNATINVHLVASGFYTEINKNKQKSKKENKKIYTQFLYIYKLKNLVQMSCYI